MCPGSDLEARFPGGVVFLPPRRPVIGDEDIAESLRREGASSVLVKAAAAADGVTLERFKQVQDRRNAWFAAHPDHADYQDWLENEDGALYLTRHREKKTRTRSRLPWRRRS